jgi:hypothetical protein
VKSIFNAYGHVHLNSFKMYAPSIPRDDYSWQKMFYTQAQETLAKAMKTRSFGHGANPMVLNTEELATLWHFPAIQIRAPLIKKIESKRAEPPVSLPFGPEGEIELGAPTEEEETPKIPMLPMEEEVQEVPITLPHEQSAQKDVGDSDLEVISLPTEEEEVVPAITLPTEHKEEDSPEVPMNLPT